MLAPTIRQPAVAGTFYPADPVSLASEVDELLESARSQPGEAPLALIAPHAGYRYSGPTAAEAFASVSTGRWERVVLVGPSHFVPFRGIATAAARRFATPLGAVAVAVDAVEALERLPGVECRPEAHEREHSLEVELPFLQRRLESFECVPIVVGEAPADAVAEALERATEGAESLIVVSSDLSHFLTYEEARRCDSATASRIAARDAGVTPAEACGARPINGLLRLAVDRGWGVDTVDLCNSGDRGGPRERVVGYGAFRLSASDSV